LANCHWRLQAHVPLRASSRATALRASSRSSQRCHSGMAKLYFRHGAMCSSKSLNLLAVVHNYREQGKKVVVIKPRLDVRFEKGAVVSRAGLSAHADILVDADSLLDPSAFTGAHCVLVDEAQFLSPYVVDQLRLLTKTHKCPVICYGLRTDFLMRTFPGSQRLLELADTIEEVKTTCQFCNRKAVFNLRIAADGTATAEGEQVLLGAEVSRLVAFSRWAAPAPCLYSSASPNAHTTYYKTSHPPSLPHFFFNFTLQDKYCPACFSCYTDRIPLVPQKPQPAAAVGGGGPPTGGSPLKAQPEGAHSD
jgi:thymidine kinase